MNGQLQVESLQKTLFDASTSWFKCEELIDDWLGHTVLEAEKTRTSTEEQTCRRLRKYTKDFSDENL